MKIISIANFKGGVGKTTSTAAIGSALAKSKKRVLLIDMDAQHNLTQSFGIEPAGAAFALLKGEQPKPEEVQSNFFIIPSDLSLIAAEIELAGKFQRETLLEKSLQPYQKDYDYILIDCPPSLGLIAVNCFMASDLLFTPIESEYLSLSGFRILSDALDQIGIEIDRVFVTKYDNRTTLHQQAKKQIFEELKSKAFKTVIRKNISLAEAPTTGGNIFEHAPTSNGAKDYESLTNEILKL